MKAIRVSAVVTQRASQASSALASASKTSTTPIRQFRPAAVLGLLAGLICLGGPVAAQSALLESVKQNPGRAKALCNQLKGFNAQGESATSPQVVGQVARQENLSPVDSEVLITYVIGLYCPDVR